MERAPWRAWPAPIWCWRRSGCFANRLFPGRDLLLWDCHLWKMASGEGGTGCSGVWRLRCVAAFAAIGRSECSVATAGVVALHRHHTGDFGIVWGQSDTTGSADDALLQRLRREPGRTAGPSAALPRQAGAGGMTNLNGCIKRTFVSGSEKVAPQSRLLACCHACPWRRMH
jgi:hypothetical protein